MKKPLFLLFNLLCLSNLLFGQVNQPGWTINAPSFKFDRDMNVEVIIEGTAVTAGGIIGAFVGEEVRGVKSGGLEAPGGKYIYVLRVYSNTDTGETVHFKFYDSAGDRVYEIAETSVFEANVNLGTAFIPFVMNCVLNDDADLLDLTVGGTTIAGFDPAVLSYSVEVPAGTVNAPVVDGEEHDPYASRVTTQAAGIPGTATIVVTAENGVATKTYTVDFAYPPNDDASLSDLSIDALTVMDFIFNPEILTYDVMLRYGAVDVPVVRPQLNDPNASLVIQYAASLPGTTTVVVTAEDGVTTLSYVLNFTVDPYKNRPYWEVDVFAFDYDGDITAEVFIDEVPTDHQESQLGAFLGEECRGVKIGGMIGPADKYIRTIRCYSNSASGETLIFKYFDPLNDTIFEIIETVPFEADMIIGTAVEPFPMNIKTTETIVKEFAIGWNWFSLNIVSEDMTVANVMSSMEKAQGDYVKNQTVSATYYDGFGWFGELTEIDPKEMYKLRLDLVEELVFEGYPADPAHYPIAINTGWNWIGYLPQVTLPVTEALASIIPAQPDYIKNSVVSATFYDGFGWFGEMTTMQALVGYMVNSTKDATLIYPDGSPSPLMAVSSRQSTVGSQTIKKHMVQGLEFNPYSFELSGQINTEVWINGEVSGGEGDMLLTKCEERVVGLSEAIKFPPTGKPVFNHMAYENSQENRNLEFYFYDSSDDQWYKFEETLEFKADMIEADAFEPFRLEKASMIKDPTSDIRHLTSLTVFPNPASDNVTINLDIPTDSDVTLEILDPLGRVIDKIQTGKLDSGNHRIEYQINHLSIGNYLIRIKDTPESFSRLIISR